MKKEKTPYKEYEICWNKATGNVRVGMWHYLVFGIICIVFLVNCMLFIIFGYGLEERNSRVLTENYKIKEISSFEELKALEGKLVLNNNYRLIDNIVLTEEITIGTQKYPFTGLFDGNGHTITYNYKADSGYKSLFGYTGENAVIKNLKVCGSLELKDGDVGAAVVAVNRGTVSNCTVGVDKEGNVKKFSISISSYATAGGIAAYNYGVIENCNAHMQVSKSNSKEVMKTCFGGICAKNIKDVQQDLTGRIMGGARCDIAFSGFAETDIFNNYDKFNGGNFYMGAVIGQNEGEAEGILYVADRGAFLSDRAIVKFLSVDEFNKLF